MIGILYICTGRYEVLWKDFFISCEKYFLPGHEKTYFVFTDADEIYAQNDQKVKKHYQENLGWPNNTLLRFEIFLKVEQQLLTRDYLFFFNGNIQFISKINADILPEDKDDGLLAVLHPGFYDKSNEQFTYERNAASTAYIPFGSGKHYFMGGFNGGITKNYLTLIKTLNNNIYKDLEQNIVAIWHDESHLNKYMLNKSPKVLGIEYGYPEGFKLPAKPKLIIRSKDKYGGADYLRKISEKKTKPVKTSFFAKVRGLIKNLLKK